MPHISTKALTYDDKEQRNHWTSPKETTGENKPTFSIKVKDLTQRDFLDACNGRVAYVQSSGMTPHINRWSQKDGTGKETGLHYACYHVTDLLLATKAFHAKRMGDPRARAGPDVLYHVTGLKDMQFHITMPSVPTAALNTVWNHMLEIQRLADTRNMGHGYAFTIALNTELISMECQSWCRDYDSKNGIFSFTHGDPTELCKTHTFWEDPNGDRHHGRQYSQQPSYIGAIGNAKGVE